MEINSESAPARKFRSGPNREKRAELYTEIATLLQSGEALSTFTLQDLLLKHGFSPHTRPQLALGLKIGGSGSTFTEETGIPLEITTYRKVLIVHSTLNNMENLREVKTMIDERRKKEEKRTAKQ